MNTWHIGGRTLEFLPDTHSYFVDGVEVPSVTQLLKINFPDLYGNVKPAVLDAAAQKGTAVHEAVENYCKYGADSALEELRGFRFLEREHGFTVLENEVPLILTDGKPIAAGRCDIVMKLNNAIYGADIKRTAKLNKEYVAAQLNIYRLAYAQSYGQTWDGLAAIHLRGKTRKLVELPLNETLAWEIVRKGVKEWLQKS